mgnify:CR=1 FL=1
MAIPERQILVCQSFRLKGDPKGVCHKKTDGFLQFIEERSSTAAWTCMWWPPAA